MFLGERLLTLRFLLIAQLSIHRAPPTLLGKPFLAVNASLAPSLFSSSDIKFRISLRESSKTPRSGKNGSRCECGIRTETPVWVKNLVGRYQNHPYGGNLTHRVKMQRAEVLAWLYIYD